MGIIDSSLSLYSLVLLFFSAFAGATLLPLSSEVVFGATILTHPNSTACLVVATLGNTLGITFNFLIGRGLLKWQRFQSLLSTPKLDSAKSLSDRFGPYVLYLSWLPIIGDPITVYLGTTKMPFLRFALIAYTLRFLRYYLIYLLLKT